MSASEAVDVHMGGMFRRWRVENGEGFGRLLLF